MRVIAFAPEFNTSGKHDATGAFRPDAEQYLKLYGMKTAPWLFDNRQADIKRRKTILDALHRQSLVINANIDAVAIFCHGCKDHIQAGFWIRHIDELARALADTRSFGDDLIVTLYACDAGRDLDKDRIDDLQGFGGDGGFADELRNALCRAGQIHCRVDAHVSAGHCSRNPFVKRFEGLGSHCGGSGGGFIISPNSKLWKKWKMALMGDLRFEYPFLTTADVIQKLI